jgi:hypothetical protein
MGYNGGKLREWLAAGEMNCGTTTYFLLKMGGVGAEVGQRLPQGNTTTQQ